MGGAQGFPVCLRVVHGLMNFSVHHCCLLQSQEGGEVKPQLSEHKHLSIKNMSVDNLPNVDIDNIITHQLTRVGIYEIPQRTRNTIGSQLLRQSATAEGDADAVCESAAAIAACRSASARSELPRSFSWLLS